jgi:hypothetical protein
MPVRTLKFQLTDAAALLVAENWEALPKRYTLLTKPNGRHLEQAEALLG